MEKFLKKDFIEYDYRRRKIEDLLENERNKLTDYAMSESPKQGYLNRMNFLLSTIAYYKQSVENFLQQIATLNQLLHGQESESEQVRDLKKQNQLLRRYLQALGKNPSDAIWMKESDFQEIKYQY